MSGIEHKPISLDGLDLAAMLASKVCHDVISPVGAIVNGLEVLDEEKDESMREFALDLIRKSARQASASLQFSRLAFGAAGSAGASVDTGDAEKVAKSYMQDGKSTLNWQVTRSLMPKNKVKLMLNLILIGMSCIPRGGEIKVSLIGEGDGAGIRLAAEGINARIPSHAAELLKGRSETGALDTHAIQLYYTSLIAKAAALDINLTIDGDKVLIEATNKA